MRTHPALGEAFGHAADVSPGSVALVAATSAGLTFLDNGQPLAPCRILSNAAGTAVYDDSELIGPARGNSRAAAPAGQNGVLSTGRRGGSTAHI